jgi:NAD(P)-dependent dehydrogenase (short-subunit alcohol dehydrogenase family)
MLVTPATSTGPPRPGPLDCSPPEFRRVGEPGSVETSLRVRVRDRTWCGAEGKLIPLETRDRIAQASTRADWIAGRRSSTAFLVSDAAAWMTGATVDLSGGRGML